MFEDFEFKNQIAQGGEGIVHLGLDKIDNLIVIIKEFPDEDEARSEIELLMALDHPCIMKIRHAFTMPNKDAKEGEENFHFCYSMPFAWHGDLKDKVTFFELLGKRIEKSKTRLILL